MTQTPPPPVRSPLTEIDITRSKQLLSDRGIDPDRMLRNGASGLELSAAAFHGLLGRVSASEKAGQDPTHALARLALASGLDNEIADTLFLAYNQQSAEEAGHGDKVFGNAYFALGGRAPELAWSVFDDASTDSLRAAASPEPNRSLLCATAAAVGGIELVALHHAFPLLLGFCDAWDQPAARDLATQINEVVRPEESRHVLTWRYVFHKLIAPQGQAAIDAYLENTNGGRQVVGAEALDRRSFERMVGTSAPAARQLLGRERVILA